MKLKISISLLLIAFFAVLLVDSCKKTDSIKAVNTTALQLEIPAGWPQPTNVFENNPLTKEGFELGRKLFYDGRLSKINSLPAMRRAYSILHGIKNSCGMGASTTWSCSHWLR